MLKASYILFLGTISVGVALAAYFTSSVERVSYIGVSGCVSCHESSSSGAIWSKWREGPHSSAFNTLLTDQSSQFIRTLSDSITSCLPCHTTLGSRPVLVGDKQLLTEGVGCESCHGPGSLYSASIIMRKPESLSQYGGSPGKLADCGLCHRLGDADPVPTICPLDSSLLDPVAAWKEMGHALPAGTRDSTVISLERGRE